MAFAHGPEPGLDSVCPSPLGADWAAYLSWIPDLPAIARRADPARIEEARRAAVRNSLIGEGVTEATADAWMAAWEA